MEKYVVISGKAGELILNKILVALELVPEIVIGECTSFSCDIEIKEEYIDVLVQQLKELGASIHKTPIAKRIEPIEISIQEMRELGEIPKVDRLPRDD